MRSQFALTMGGAGLVLGIVVTAALEWRLETSAVEAQRHALQVAANEVGARLAADLRARKREIVLAADLLGGASFGGPDEARALLDTLHDEQSSYAWIGLTDARGRVLASTGRLLENVDVSARPWFSRAQDGVILEDPHEAKLLAGYLSKATDGEPLRFVDVAAPVRRGGGAVSGVLGAHLYLSWVGKVVEHVSMEQASDAPMEFLVADRTGKVLWPLAYAGSHALAQIEADNLQSAEYLIGRSLAEVDNGSDLQWAVMARQPMSAVLAPIERARALMVGAAVVIGLVFLAVTWLVASNVVRPIRRLADKAHRFEPGSDAVFRSGDESRRDEVGSLARTMGALVARLRAHEAQFRATFEQAAVGIAHVDTVGRWIRVNDRLCDIVGYTREELLGKTFQDITHPDDLQTDLAHMHALLAGAVTHYRIDKRYLRKGGDIVWITLTVALVRHQDGAPHYFVSVVEDISERKHGEEALRHSERRLRLATEAAGIGIFEWDYKTDIIVWSPELRAMHGLAPEPDKTGAQPDYFAHWQRCLHPDDAPTALARVQAVREAGGGAQADWRVVMPDGSTRWVAARFQSFTDEAGLPSHMVGVNLDVTDRKAMEEELRDQAALLSEFNQQLQRRVDEQTREITAAKEAAEKANEAKSSFLANMSHEIRTPMNAIIGLSGLLRRQNPAGDMVERLTMIEGAGKHLLTVIDDILDLSRIEAGQLQLEEQAVDVGALVAQVVAIVTESAHAKGIRLATELGPLPPQLLGDPTRLRQALLNLVGNAVKFTSIGTVTVRADCEIEDTASVRVRFEVDDSGPGIAPAAMERLFTPFVQADASTVRRYGGTGLGLAITRRLAQLMGGEAGARSVPEEGSTFWFTARLQKLHAVATLEDGTMVQDAGEALRQRATGTRVLLVEDNELNRLVAQSLLEEVGFKCDLAEDGQQAIEALQRTGMDHYSVILMDMQMPRLDGLSATRVIRSMEVSGSRRVPILAMTANAFVEDQRSCLDAGMNDVITKPVDPDALYRTLGKWV